MSSFSYLIELARRTGDTLIVHNSIDGSSVVLMGIANYELLHNNSSRSYRDVRGLSSDQMLDQINRDIAIWRTEKEMDSSEEDGFSFDSTEDWRRDISSENWHTTRGLLRDRYQDRYDGDYDEMRADDDLNYYDDDDDIDDDDGGDEYDGVAGVDGGEADRQPVGSLASVEEDQINFFPAEEPIISPMSKDLPVGFDRGLDWQDEPNDDDPVFLEEPILF